MPIDKSAPTAGDTATGNNPAEQEPPRIEFPCLYPIKIIGYATEVFQREAVATVERHTGTITPDLIKVQDSRSRNYLSVTVTIAATGKDQLENIFEDLKKLPDLKMVL
jgi:putative lipoic acid-binding regulatory protein